MPITLSNGLQQQQQQTAANSASNYVSSSPSPFNSQQHPLELTKPILFDCDYQYEPEVDAKLTIRWFRNKETEPFYQWLPELNLRHFADWIKPLVNESFVSDPSDPLKRFRSLLIKRLSMNLTAHYTCIVSSLAGQDTRQASLIVYQPPRSFTFEQRTFPPPPQPPPIMALYPAQVYNNPTSVYQTNSAYQQPTAKHKTVIVRPPNNNHDNQRQNQSASSIPNNNETRIVYTHDGRAIKRPVNKQQQRFRRQLTSYPYPVIRTSNIGSEDISHQELKPRFVVQLHQFQCQASQVTPRPMIVLTVKRDSDSIAQYLHESSSVSIRPYQVNQADYYHFRHNSKKLIPLLSQKLKQQALETTSYSDNLLTINSNIKSSPQANNISASSNELAELQRESDLQFTLYDITVSATIALNVTLPPASSSTLNTNKPVNSSSMNTFEQLPATSLTTAQFGQINTVLNFRRGQRMSFECHLEITGTEFEQRKRININEEG